MSSAILEAVRAYIPPLDVSKHKGEMGRLAVVGGSKEYTGAPYFSAITCLYCGADLVHVLCASAASTVIKSYSPELIVHPVLDNDLEEATKLIDRVHAVVIGPGLGLAENIENASKLLVQCRKNGKPLVIDADGLSIVNKTPSIISGYKCSILTPNVVEFSRLYYAVLGKEPTSDTGETTILASALGGVTILRKGPNDVISDGTTTVVCDETGSPRRCGGQGDLLSGSSLVFTHWLNEAAKSSSLPFAATIGAAVAASTLTRRCSKLAFVNYGRSMVTSNMLTEVHTAFEQLFGRC